VYLTVIWPIKNEPIKYTSFYLILWKKVFIAPLSHVAPYLLVAAHVLVGSQHTFLSWQQKWQKIFSEKMSKKNMPRMTKNHSHWRNIKRARLWTRRKGIDLSVIKTSWTNNQSLLVKSTNFKCVQCFYLVSVSIHNVVMYDLMIKFFYVYVSNMTKITM